MNKRDFRNSVENPTGPVIGELSTQRAEEEAKAQLAKKSLKLSNKSEPKIDKKAEFEKTADDSFNKAEEKKARSVKLSQEFVGMLKDTKIAANRGPLEQANEKRIFQELIQFASELNNDPEEDQESLGSVVLNSLIIKILFYQRDRINELNKELYDFKRNSDGLER